MEITMEKSLAHAGLKAHVGNHEELKNDLNIARMLQHLDETFADSDEETQAAARKLFYIGLKAKWFGMPVRPKVVQNEKRTGGLL